MTPRRSQPVTDIPTRLRTRAAALRKKAAVVEQVANVNEAEFLEYVAGYIEALRMQNRDLTDEVSYWRAKS